MDKKTVQALAKALDQAAREAAPIPCLTQNEPDLDVRSAWKIQEALVQLRIKRKARLMGYKMGLTSRAKMEQMGVHTPIFGRLTADMLIPHGGSLDAAAFIHPKVEPEVAFILGREISEPMSAAQAMTHVDGVCAALDLLDSRYEAFRFTLPDVIADNASSAGFAVGPTVRPAADLDLGCLGLVMEINGEVVATGSTAAILDHPAESLAMLTRLAASAGFTLPEGTVVLAGAATAAAPLRAGDRVRLRADGLGEVGFRMLD